ncbi:MAG: ABC transporter permease [Dehalococcoidia bacterium]|jgi:ABC-type dipeptide/oligopeptide/nickel transport system permease component
MSRFIVIRLIQCVVAFFGILIITFFLLRASGDPAMLLASPNFSAEQVQALRVELGLDKSWGEQLGIYLNNIVHGDLGESLLQKKPVITKIGDALPNTLKLMVPSFAIAMILAFILGVLAATYRDSWWDNIVKFLAVLGQALPGFWVAIMAVLILSVQLEWLPVAGMATPAHYVLPVSTIVFFTLPGMMRLVRSTMLDVLDSEYIKLARIKGLPERIVIWKHALRNALISPLTIIGMLLPGVVMGAVITEQIFNWPGMGRLLVDATFSRDFPVVQAVTIITAILVLGINLLIDISYAWVDPQIRFQRT